MNGIFIYQVLDEKENDEKKCREQNLEFRERNQRKQLLNRTCEQGWVRRLVATHRAKDETTNDADPHKGKTRIWRRGTPGENNLPVAEARHIIEGQGTGKEDIICFAPDCLVVVWRIVVSTLRIFSSPNLALIWFLIGHLQGHFHGAVPSVRSVTFIGRPCCRAHGQARFKSDSHGQHCSSRRPWWLTQLTRDSDISLRF